MKSCQNCNNHHLKEAVIKMWYMSKKEYESRLKKIKYKNLTKERKAKLKAEMAKYKPKRKPPSTSKIILFAVFLLCIQIVAFCEYAMITLSDASAMYVLIGIPATLVPTVISYYNKSRAENTVGGIVFETAMQSKQCDEEEDLSGDDAVG